MGNIEMSICLERMFLDSLRKPGGNYQSTGEHANATGWRSESNPQSQRFEANCINQSATFSLNHFKYINCIVNS